MLLSKNINRNFGFEYSDSALLHVKYSNIIKYQSMNIKEFKLLQYNTTQIERIFRYIYSIAKYYMIIIFIRYKIHIIFIELYHKLQIKSIVMTIDTEFSQMFKVSMKKNIFKSEK